MEQITAYFLSFLEVMEKELSLFGKSVSRTVLGLCMIATGAFLVGMGILTLAWTCFTAVKAFAGPVGAGLVATAFIFACGGACFWIGKKNSP